jgi:hypothetical protein
MPVDAKVVVVARRDDDEADWLAAERAHRRGVEQRLEDTRERAR